MRTQLIAELASNHGGDWHLACDMIRAAADAGADYVKVQLYDASKLKADDPQKAWLTQSQVTGKGLDTMLRAADSAGVKLAASVFGLDEVAFAQSRLLPAIKVGSGDSSRIELVTEAARAFGRVWLSEGLMRATLYDMGLTRAGDLGYTTYAAPVATPFYGVSQYPTPLTRGLAMLLRSDKSAEWGWSDHGADLHVAEQAILYGATYLERHFSWGQQARWQAWDTDVDGFKQLRRHAEACAWEGTSEHQAACEKYLGRWGE